MQAMLGGLSNTNWGGKGGVATFQAIEELQTVGSEKGGQNKSTLFSVLF